MATYNPRSLNIATALDNEAEVLCDAHSVFDAEGFPLPLNDQPRSWTPVWGAPCTLPGCGQDT